MPNQTEAGHLDLNDFHDFVERQLPGKRAREIESHLDSCPDCVETLSMIVRSERAPTREEEALLARLREPIPDEVVERLRREIEASSPDKRKVRVEWRPLAVAAVLLVSATTTGWYVYTRAWLPAESRRTASETMSAMVELRQATGRIPLRYITEFERASVTRSGFDSDDPAEEALVSNLRTAISRAPEPEAVLALGLLLLDAGEIDEAESLFQQVILAEPQSVDALNGLAVVNYERSQRDAGESYRHLQKGLALLREAQAAAPEDLRVLYNFGKFYEALEMEKPAMLAWSRYLQKDQATQWAEEAAYQLAQLMPR